MTQPVVIENFALSASQFTVFGINAVAPGTLTIAGGQGAINNPSSIFQATCCQDSLYMPIVDDQFFVYTEIGSGGFPPVTTGGCNMSPGIFKDHQNLIMFEFGSNVDPTIFELKITVIVAGAIFDLGVGTVPSAAIPNAVGLDARGNTMEGWVRYGATWTKLVTVDVSPYIDITVPGALVGYYAGMSLNTTVANAMNVSLLWSGPPLAELDSVPDVVNTSASVVAPGAITAAGFTVGDIAYAASVLIISGNVIAQFPAAGAVAPIGSPVDLVVSTGRAGLLVPLILFLTEPEAIDALVSIGLVPGAISFAPSTTFAAGEVMAQNPSAGNPVAYGSIVGFVVSTGTPIVSNLFDTTPTVISQYANSPTLLQWISNMNLYLDQSVNFAQFLAYVWNVNTAVGFGLNILGRIVNVSRLLQIPNTTPYVGFDNGTRSPSDWEPLGSNLPGGGGIGALYSGHNATQAYLLDDDAYRQLILAKAFANICSTTAASINRILQNLYGDNNAWVLNTGTMSISYNFRFRPSPIQLAILQQSGVIPTPPGVAVTIVSP